jgi:transposase
MKSMPPDAVTVADLLIESDAILAFALEQNRLAWTLRKQ